MDIHNFLLIFGCIVMPQGFSFLVNALAERTVVWKAQVGHSKPQRIEEQKFTIDVTVEAWIVIVTDITDIRPIGQQQDVDGKEAPPNMDTNQLV